MAEVDAALIYDALMSIDGRMAALEAGLTDIRNDIAGMSGAAVGIAVQLGVIHTDLVNLQAGQRAIDTRFGRIERRLGASAH